MDRHAQALDLMMRFAERTGVVGDAPQKRYLWTDAFAVCNFLAVGREDLARQLVEHVHRVLGRGDADRPTRGGLRIGKPMPERGPNDRYDEQLEWDRDGQYFHYLTKWMHALDVMARATGDARYARWARELAVVAHDRFVYDTRGDKRMYWKMSIDLARPLVPTMGHHDPLDGFITAVQLRELPAAVVTDFGSMLALGRLATSDPLGLGGLLVDACRVSQMIEQHAWLDDVDLLDPLLDGALFGLRHLHVGGPPQRRLGFRELGLAIGLAGVEMLQRAKLPRSTALKLAQVAEHVPLRRQIEELWLAPENRRARTWVEHLDINEVMLATSLVPSGFLVLSPHRAAATAQRHVHGEQRRHS